MRLMPANKRHRKLKIAGLLALIILCLVLILSHHHRAAYVVKSGGAVPTKKQTSQKAVFDKERYSVDQADSPWVVVNKGRILSADYIPSELVVPAIPLRLDASSGEMHLSKPAADALQALSAAAKTQGIDLMLASGYRSYSLQASVYSGYVKNDGQASADAYSARPGHSEHQTGMSADLEPKSRTCEVTDCFATTPEGQWLAAHCYEHGFIIRYPKDKQNLTGYSYEPWHVRYVGVDLAAQIKAANQTMEQFFGLPTYANYPSQSFSLR